MKDWAIWHMSLRERRIAVFSCVWGILTFAVSFHVFSALNPKPSPCPAGSICTAIAATELSPQKPTEQPKTAQQIAAAKIADQVIQKLSGQNVRVDLGEIKTKGSVEFYDNGAFSRWIEQHCVALYKPQTIAALIAGDTTKNELHSFQLRCTPDKEQK